VPDGTIVRMSNQGGTLPTYAPTTAFVQTTAYYWRNRPEMQRVTISGSPTGGTMRYFDGDNPQSSVSVVYNAGWEVQTVAMTGTPTSGTYILTYAGNSTAAIAHNANSATVQAALRLVPGLSLVTVVESGSTPNYTHTVHFNGVEGNIAQMTNTDSTSGGTHTLTNATVSNGTATSLQTSLRTMEGWGSVTVEQAGTSPNFVHWITMTGLPGDRRQVGVDARSLSGGTPIIAFFDSFIGGGSLYPTSGDAIADTNAYDIDGAGTGTHYLIFEGATSYEYDAAGLSGAGGWTDDGTDATTTIGHATLNAQVPNRVFVRRVTGCSGGYVIFGDSTTDGNRYVFALVNDLQTAMEITPDGGFTPLEYGDLGRTLVQGSNTGTIVGFDNSIPAIWVTPSSTSTFPGGAAVAWTITSGAGSGTQTAAAVSSVFWDDCGATATYSLTPESWDTFTCGPYRRVGRMSSTIYKPGDWMVYPLSSSAVWYLCVESQSIPNSSAVRGNKTASSAPSFSGSYGATTRDGDITWLRIDRPCPTTLPSAAVADALETTVTAVSGTTVTVADAATTSVTSSPVLHDDTWAALAHYSVVRDSAEVATFHWPEGRYPIYTGVIGTDARLAGGVTLFPCSPSSGQLVQKTTWDLAHASVFWIPGDVSGSLTDTTDFVTFMYLTNAHQTIRGPGRFICAANEPHLERYAGYNQFHFSKENSSGDCEIVGPYISDVQILGFPRPISWNLEYDNEDAPVLRNVHMDYGYAGNDGGVYMPGGLISGGSLMGMRGFDCSVAIYQDFNNFDQAFTITDGFFGAYWRQNGFRIRQSDVKVHGCTFYMCQQLFVSETIDGLSIQGNYLYETDILLGADSQTKIAGNTLIDSELQVNSGSRNANIHDNTIWFNPSFYTPTGSQASAVVISGTDTNFHHNTIDARGRGATVQALGFTGTGTRAIVDTNIIKGASGTQQLVRFNTPSCNIKFTNNEVREEFIASNANYIQNAGTLVFRGNRWWNPSGISAFDIDAGGDITIDGDESNHAWDFGSAITGPVRIKNARFQSATATVFVEPSITIENTNFAVAPTLTGATQFTSGNSVADAKSVSATALAASQNNYALPVTDTVILTTSGTNNYSITGFAARAAGTRVVIVNGDATDTITLEHADGSSSAANQIRGTGGADVVLGPGESAEMDYANSLWQATEK
jgi:hypothetical protein